MSSIDSTPAGVTSAPSTPPKNTLDFDKEAKVGSKQPVPFTESPTVSPTTKKRKSAKKKKATKGKGDLISSDSDNPPPLAKKSSKNKLSVKTKVGSSVPLRTPADYQDIGALNLNFSVLWDDANWSNKEVGLSADDLCQRNKKRRRQMWRKMQVQASEKNASRQETNINMGDMYRRDQNNQRRLSESTYTRLKTRGTFREDL